MNELKLIAKMAKQLNVMPNIGIRIKLASSGSGNGKIQAAMQASLDSVPVNCSKHSTF